MQVVAQQDLDSLGTSAKVSHTLMSAAAAPTAAGLEKKRKADEPKASAKEKAKADAAPSGNKSKKLIPAELVEGSRSATRSGETSSRVLSMLCRCEFVLVQESFVDAPSSRALSCAG